MDPGVMALVARQRLQESIQSGILEKSTEQSTEQTQLALENQDNLIRVLISVGSVVASLGTLASGLLALALAKRIYDRGVEAACRLAEKTPAKSS